MVVQSCRLERREDYAKSPLSVATPMASFLENARSTSTGARRVRQAARAHTLQLLPSCQPQPAHDPLPNLHTLMHTRMTTALPANSEAARQRGLNLVRSARAARALLAALSAALTPPSALSTQHHPVSGSGSERSLSGSARLIDSSSRPLAK
jgi:hypothetical protein